MAKKVTGYIKLQIPAGKATPAPPVGPALGQHGVNIVEFTKQFNALQRLLLLQFFLRKLATLSQVQVFLTRQRLLQLREQKFRRLLNSRCLI